jgi:hypothetical protein
MLVTVQVHPSMTIRRYRVDVLGRVNVSEAVEEDHVNVAMVVYKLEPM